MNPATENRLQVTSRTPRSGFTMVEMLVVLVLIGIMSAIAVPVYGRWKAEMNLEFAAQSLLVDIRTAKSYANRTKIRHWVEIDPHAGWRLVRAANSGDLADDPATVLVLRHDSLINRAGKIDGTGLSAGSLPPGIDLSTAATHACQDGVAYPATTSVAGTWVNTKNTSTAPFLVTACGGSTADVSNGVIFLTSSASTNVQYAVIFVDWGVKASIQPQLWRWKSNQWEEL